MLKLKLNNNRNFNYNRNVILCTSGLFIPYTISLIEKFKNTSTLVTQSKEIFKFFSDYYPKLDIVFFEHPKSLTNKNLFRMIKNNYYNYLLKKKIKIFLNQYFKSNVFTCIEAFSPYSAYMLIILSKKNKIYHQRIVKLNWKKKKPNLKYRILKFFYKINLNIDLDIFEIQKNKYVLPYSSKFFKKIGAKKIGFKINKKVIKKFIEKNFIIKTNNILLLSSSIALEFKLIDKTLFKKFLKKWSLTRNFKKIIFKRKNFKEKKIYQEKILKELPSFIPANLLIYNFKIVIGIYSATLFEAANKSCKAISLLYILSKDAKTINFYENYLNKNLQRNKKIFYPKTFEQFINYLK